VRERRCFVQFIHPGGEHWPDRGDRKFWNREAHRRKFLKGRGRYITGGEAREGEIVFWGEWEPESRVLARYSDQWEFRHACRGMRPFSTLWSLRSQPEGSINGSIPTARWSRRKSPSTRKRRFAALLRSPLTDSNRRPPPYHGSRC
jgi:hypothetical protein